MHKFYLCRTIMTGGLVRCLCIAAFMLMAAPALAADIIMYAGSGGGGGAGAGATEISRGGFSGAMGGAGALGVAGSGGAGGGGSGGDLTDETGVQDGGDAVGSAPGSGGAAGYNGVAGGAGSTNVGTKGGAGGNGGAVTFISNASAAGKIDVTAGMGGQGGQGGSEGDSDGGVGGNGGAASLTVNPVGGTLTVTTLVDVQGGNSGRAAPEPQGLGKTGSSGSGGNAGLTINGALNTNRLRVTSGLTYDQEVGLPNPGTGGYVHFTATTLSATEIGLIKNSGGNLAFNIGTLDATSGDTALLLGETSAGTSSITAGGNGVYIGTARLGDGTLAIKPPFFAGAFHTGKAFINTLELTGSGIFDDPKNADLQTSVTLGSLTLNGGTLNAANWSGIVEHDYSVTYDINLGESGGTFDLGAGETRTLTRNLTGTGALVKNGAGTLVLGGFSPSRIVGPRAPVAANTYSGGTIVNEGVLEGNSNTIQGAVLNNAVVRFEQGMDGTYAGIMSGTGSLIKSGAGTLTLGGANTYSGGTTVSEGVLAGNSNTIQGTVVNNAAVLFDQNVNGTYAGIMSGTGSLTKSGAGTLILGAANTYSGGTTVNEGELAGNTGTIQGDVINNSAVLFAQNVNGTYAGIMSGTGSLTKSGAGTLTLGAANTYSGGTTVSEGVLAGNSGTIQGDVVNNSAVLFDQNAAGTYAGTMSGTGSLTKSGTGTLTLGTANTYSGMTTVTAGTLEAGALANSTGLILHAGTAFRNSGSHSLNGKSLTVYEGNIDYEGDLSAAGATLNFIVPVLAAGPVIAVDGNADISNATVKLSVANDARLPGETTYELLQSTGALNADGITAGGGVAGYSRLYQYTLSTTADTLLAHLTSIKAEPGVLKSPAEGQAAAAATMNQGADLAAGQGIDNARAAAGQTESGLAGFIAVSGGASRYNSGSHVDVNSYAFMTGLARKWQPGPEVLAGAFFEAGWASYTSYNGLEDGSSFKGKGDSRYTGGGLLARVDAVEGALRGLYGEATLRAGGLYGDYKSAALPGGKGERGTYKRNSTYVGAHLGAGYVWQLSEKADLDVYAKYFWGHSTGGGVHILGEPLRFKATDSHRARLGVRFGYTVNEYLRPYAGAGIEYEFGGKVRSVLSGESVPAPSLKGATGLGELGLTWKPSAASPIAVDFGVTGYTGKRQGVSGKVQLKYTF